MAAATILLFDEEEVISKCKFLQIISTARVHNNIGMQGRLETSVEKIINNFAKSHIAQPVDGLKPGFDVLKFFGSNSSSVIL